MTNYAGLFYHPEESWTNASDLQSIWSGCQSIARQLLTTPIPTVTTEADEIRAALQELGVEAHPSKEDPFGTIDIAEGPVRQVRVGLR